MLPILEAILHQYPFRIIGFHCDNGSEFLNRQVAKMLGKLLVEFTKSRAYRTTDNAPAEGKNGAVVRKHIGYGFIASAHAESLQKFFSSQFNPYLNFHRPCGFAVLVKGERGRIKRRYRADDYRTPFEKLCSLENWRQYLKPGTSEELLRSQAMQTQRHRGGRPNAEGQARHTQARPAVRMIAAFHQQRWSLQC